MHVCGRIRLTVTYSKQSLANGASECTSDFSTSSTGSKQDTRKIRAENILQHSKQMAAAY